jgi:hypothetical protein
MLKIHSGGMLKSARGLAATCANSRYCVAQQVARHLLIINFKSAIGYALANFLNQVEVEFVGVG